MSLCSTPVEREGPIHHVFFGFGLCNLSTLNYAGAGLSIHMMGEVSWEPKEDDRGPLSIQSSMGQIVLRTQCTCALP